MPSNEIKRLVISQDGNIYVAYAPAGRPAQISAPLGAGAVAIFDEDGNFITQLITGGRLAAP